MARHTTAEQLRAIGNGSFEYFLNQQKSEGKVLLAYCACCRYAWDYVSLECNRKALEASERYADGLATLEELQECWDSTRFEPVIYHSWLRPVLGPANRDAFDRNAGPRTPEDREAMVACPLKPPHT
jgi:hypothetical protein